MSQTRIEIATSKRKECIDITPSIREIIRASGVREGLCHVMALHATAAIIVNENDDPNIGIDLLRALGRSIPEHDEWLHDQVDNNAQAHILASILGPSETVPIQDGQLLLGTWQGIMLVELDGPRAARRIVVTILPTLR